MERIDNVAGRKLALDKETLRTLGDAELRDVAGGFPTTIIIGPTAISISAVTISLITRTTAPPTDTNPPDDPKDPEDTGNP
jgi:hypothetical protein